MFWLTQRTTELFQSVSTGRIAFDGLCLPESNERIAHDVLNAHAKGRHLYSRNHKLEHKDGHTAGHPASQRSETEEEDDAGLPCDAGAAVAERIRAQALLLDRVDDQHPQAGEDEGEPVDEFDVDIGGVHLRSRPDCRVQHHVEGYGELCRERIQVSLYSKVKRKSR